MKGPFLIRKTGTKAKAHIWLGGDTACRMWSTGGMKQSRFEVYTELGSHEICHLCAMAEANLFLKVTA